MSADPQRTRARIREAYGKAFRGATPPNTGEQVDAAAREALQMVKERIADIEELSGTIPPAVYAEIIRDPETVLRAAVRATKKDAQVILDDLLADLASGEAGKETP